MQSALNKQHEVNPVEIAILAKWLLHETWLCIEQVLEKHLSDRMITAERKTKLQEMITDLFNQAFYAPVITTSDIDQLLKNSRHMLSVLKELDVKAWSIFMMENGKPLLY